MSQSLSQKQSLKDQLETVLSGTSKKNIVLKSQTSWGNIISGNLTRLYESSETTSLQCTKQGSQLCIKKQTNNSLNIQGKLATLNTDIEPERPKGRVNVLIIKNNSMISNINNSLQCTMWL